MNGTVAPTADIDHLLTNVTSLDAAADFFRRMGFTLSPISRIDGMGISNHMVLMHPRGQGRANYIELMAAHDVTKLPPPMVPILTGPNGIGSMVLSTVQLDALHERIVELGYKCAPPVHVQREWKIPGESSVFPEFDVIMPVEAPLRFNACKYYNIELYLRPEWLEHQNTALRVTHVFAVTDQRADAAIYEKVFGRTATLSADGGYSVAAGDFVLDVMTPTTAQSRFGLAAIPKMQGVTYLGYQIGVKSLGTLRGCLDRGQIPYRIHGATICIDFEAAFGNLIVFSEVTI